MAEGPLQHSLTRPGADGQDGTTPLITAAWNGKEGVVRVLLEAKAQIEAADKVSLWVCGTVCRWEVCGWL